MKEKYHLYKYDLVFGFKSQLVEGSSSLPVEVQVGRTFSDEEININSVETSSLPMHRIKEQSHLADQKYTSQNSV